MKNINVKPSQLLSISLLDGRNADKVEIVSEYFSEYALIKYRMKVEVEYLIFLSEKTSILRKLTKKECEYLRGIYNNFSLKDAIKVKEEERKINHDVKAVEYFLKKKVAKTSLKNVSEFFHFAITSYDVNTPSYAMMLRDFRNEVYIKKINELLEKLKNLIIKTKSMSMLAKTHGQPALPTTLGKELAVFYKRIQSEKKVLEDVHIEAKLTGAVGNFNSFHFTDSTIDWMKFSEKFIQSLGLKPNIITTQILPYDSWIQLFDSVNRINNILLGLSTDIWWYISFEYFLQKKKDTEVGSSTMSHKINPISFENAEGNLGLANSMFEFFSRKLSYSRLQRDLSDSTVKRNFGLAFGHSLLAIESLLSGLSRIEPNEKKMSDDLEVHWEIFSEGIQVYLKAKGYKNAFEVVKEKTRGKILTKLEIYALIDDLPIKKQEKEYLKIKTVSSYIGIAEKLANHAISFRL